MKSYIAKPSKIAFFTAHTNQTVAAAPLLGAPPTDTEYVPLHTKVLEYG